MIEIRQTETFEKWLNGLKDRQAVNKIAKRLVRVESGLFGDFKTVGKGVSELRIDHGQGYRIYFTRRENIVVILLCGGDKKSQNRDIALAQEMQKEV